MTHPASARGVTLVRDAVQLDRQTAELLAGAMRLRELGLPLTREMFRAEADFRRVVTGDTRAPFRGSPPHPGPGEPSTHDAETPQDTAARWGVTDRRVRDLAAQGRIPGAHRTQRGHWRIPAGARREDVDRTVTHLPAPRRPAPAPTTTRRTA